MTNPRGAPSLELMSGISFGLLLKWEWLCLSMLFQVHTSAYLPDRQFYINNQILVLFFQSAFSRQAENSKVTKTKTCPSIRFCARTLDIPGLSLLRIYFFS